MLTISLSLPKGGGPGVRVLSRLGGGEDAPCEYCVNISCLHGCGCKR